MNHVPRIPTPANEPILNFERESKEREGVKRELDAILAEVRELPLIIGGRAVKTGTLADCRLPCDHGRVIARYHVAGEGEIDGAIASALEAKERWEGMPWEHRMAVFLKAAELLSKKYRYKADALTMLVHSKNPFQAEIDIAELIDFWRFNAYYAQQIYEDQPMYSPIGMWNRVEQRPLEGFVFAVSPFNFISIGGNLPTAPAMMGNVVLWKPASSVVCSNHFIMEVLVEAGLPAGVINFLAGNTRLMGAKVLGHPMLAGVHFTGSTSVFHGMWRTVGENIAKYRGYPRLVGETGGKDFIFVHPSADADEVATAISRGAFEYQGQKCSAASRAYVPRSLWPRVKERVTKDIKSMRMGTPADFGNFVNAVIDKAAYESIKAYIDAAKKAKDAEVVCGGGCDDKKGWFIEPTLILAKDPRYATMQEEVFGPVMTVHVYEDKDFEKALKLCDETSPYALTGSIFSRDRGAVVVAERALAHAAGNFYINDKPTGAVVGQQPFGGARASGTNDKAGSRLNLLRWVSPRTIKETFVPPRDYRYPFLA
jgi:1-pyrroline-5-carboxylate dehydrogenase